MEFQSAFHRNLFAALYRWDTVWEFAIDIAGNEANARRLGLDQLGHFGPVGVELVANRLVAAASGPLNRVVELGSGLGGALRQLGQALRAASPQTWLAGVELVPEHCSVAAAIGRCVGDTTPHIVCADVRQLPFAAVSVDAAVAIGSASHFSDMPAAISECGRILRTGGVLVVTEEVSIRAQGACATGAAFELHHPSTVFHSTTPEERRRDLESAGFALEAFEPLTDWAVPLLRQRVRALNILAACAVQIFGADAYRRTADTLTSAADEYERGTVTPMLVVARRAQRD